MAWGGGVDRHAGRLEGDRLAGSPTNQETRKGAAMAVGSLFGGVALPLRRVLRAVLTASKPDRMIIRRYFVCIVPLRRRSRC
jgi:hypothetical protein